MTNAAAIGYAILAAEEIGLTQEQISKLSKTAYRIMDRIDESEAEKIYRKTP